VKNQGDGLLPSWKSAGHYKGLLAGVYIGLDRFGNNLVRFSPNR